MKKQDFISVLAEQLGVTKVKAAEIYGTVTDLLVQDLLENGETVLHDIGKFALVTRAARTVHNPQTLELMNIPSRTAVRFRVAKSLKVNAAAVEQSE